MIDKGEWDAAAAAAAQVNQQSQQQQQQQEQPEAAEHLEGLPSGGPNTLQERLHRFRAERSFHEAPVAQAAYHPYTYLSQAPRANPDASIQNRLVQLRESLN